MISQREIVFLGKSCLGKFSSFNPFNPRYSNQTKISKSLSNQKKRSKGTKKQQHNFSRCKSWKKTTSSYSLQSFCSSTFQKVQFPMAPWPHVVSSILLEPKTCPGWDTLRKKNTKKNKVIFVCRNAVDSTRDSDRSLCLTNYASQMCFQFVIVILPAGHFLLQWLHFRLECRKSNGFPIKNKNKFGEGWGCHLTILWGRSFKSWWTAWISPQKSWNSKPHKNISYPPGN